jgi:hypothetical protein
MFEGANFGELDVFLGVFIGDRRINFMNRSSTLKRRINKTNSLILRGLIKIG